MPRKTKKHFQHTKQQAIETEDGWTHVVRGPSIKMANSNDKAEAAAQVQKLVAERDFDSVEEMKAAYEKHKDIVLKHPATANHLAYLDQQLMEHPNVECSHVVCLALGHFDAGYGTASLKQLAFLEEVIALLQRRKRIGEPTLVYFQDPSFTKLDTLFLTEMGHHVIPFPFWQGDDKLFKPKFTRSCGQAGGARCNWIPKDQTAQIACASHFSDSMFLFMPHVEWNVIPDAFRTAHPALYLGMTLPGLLNWGVIDEDRDDYGKNDGKLKAEVEAMSSKYDWQPEYKVAGQETEWWYNNIEFGMKKVPADWEVDSAARDSEIARREQNPVLIMSRMSDTDRSAYFRAFLRDRATINTVEEMKTVSGLVGVNGILAWGTTLRKLLVDAAAKNKLTGAMCIGIGHLSARADPEDSTGFERLGVFRELVSTLKHQKKLPEDAPVFVQGSSLTDLDATFIKEHRGFDVIIDQPASNGNGSATTNSDHSAEKGQVTAGTFVFCPDPATVEAEGFILGGKPIVYVGPMPDAEGKLKTLLEESNWTRSEYHQDLEPKYREDGGEPKWIKFLGVANIKGA